MSGITQYDVAVLGAGPSGLTAAYCLGKAGARVAVLERAPHCGGLMRGIKRGPYAFDLGRKELYSRFAEVHALWSELLGDAYREYPHRIGVLHGGRLLEKSSAPRGKSRGLSVGQLAQLGTSYVAAQVRPGAREARTLEDFYVQRYGRAYYDMFIRGYQQKFEGRAPSEVPNEGNDGDVRRFAFLRGKAAGAASSVPSEDILFSQQYVWRHPAKGTQQIVDGLEAECRRAGITFLLDTDVNAVNTDATDAHRLCYRHNGEPAELAARCVVSSLPLPLLMGLLQPQPEQVGPPPREESLFKKSTALVYLMLNEPPRFAHNWVEVTDMRLKAGRVVNYATWNGEMVPEGKTALCVEFFGLEDDPVMSLGKEDLRTLAVKEMADCGLIDPARIEDHLVIQLPKVNASTAIGERKQAWLRAASGYLETLPRFFETSRPGMDRATLAGIDAAEACMSGAAMSRRSLAVSSKEL